MLQNRVDPQGNIIKTGARGLWMGNRGQLHDEHQQLLRSFKLKAWLICLLEFKGKKRQIMAPNRYTELFFLDEATAFAAGHRPCFECRRKDYDLFKSCWLKGNSQYGFDENTSIQQIDAIFHKERVSAKGEKITYQNDCDNLPDGSFILFDQQPYLIANNALYAWTAFGYNKAQKLPKLKPATVLTPRSVVQTFRAGYKPQMGVLRE